MAHMPESRGTTLVANQPTDTKKSVSKTDWPLYRLSLRWNSGRHQYAHDNGGVRIST